MRMAKQPYSRNRISKSPGRPLNPGLLRILERVNCRLALAELRRAAGSLEAVFLALLHARVAREGNQPFSVRGAGFHRTPAARGRGPGG